MGCCNARTLSWIVASFNLIFGILGVLGLIVALCLPKQEQPKRTDPLRTRNVNVNGDVASYHQVLYIICALLLVPFTITLMVGISKNRHKLFVPYLYLQYFCVFVAVSVGIHRMVGKINMGLPIGDAVIYFVIELVMVAIGCLFIWPVYVLRNQIRSAPIYPEQHDLRTNQPVNKPYYAQGGQI